MLRNAWFYICLIWGTLFFSIIACMFFWDKRGRVPTWCGHTWSRLLLWSAGVKVETDLSAMDAIPRERGVIFMVNHQSQLDILILYTLLNHKHPAFIAKKSLIKLPALGPAIAAAGHIFIDRSNHRQAMRSIDQAAETLRAGRSIIIFPEGTRSTDLSKLGEFKIGGMVLALKCDAPVVPLLIIGSGRIIPKGGKVLPRGDKRVLIKALQPMDAGNYTLKEREQFKNDLHERMNLAYLELNQWPKTNHR